MIVSNFSSSIPITPRRIGDESILVSSTGGEFDVLDCAVNAEVGVDTDDESDPGFEGEGTDNCA